MRPRTLDEVAGQRAVVGPEGFLRRAVAADRVPSLVFWGPPGCGKTTLARLVAEATRAEFVPFSAVTSGIQEIKKVMLEAERLRRSTGRRTLLFVDEIHRFNRAQQDAFLPYVERGDIVLVGATTENPSFELNAALLSRCRVVVLEPLSTEDLNEVLLRALREPVRGLGKTEAFIEGKALDSIVQLASGDARRALTLLELVVEDADASGRESVAAGDVQRVAQRKTLVYDKRGEEHFNLISALHKSLRESDPDAALYWLARMLEAGEQPEYLARRLTRFASEDVGLADPGALRLALAGWAAYERLGSPEGDLALAELTIYLALAPKSVAVYRAWGEARRAVAERPAEPVPLAIRNAPTRLMKELGYGRDYVYAPDSAEGVAGLDCLPDALRGTIFYTPTAHGAEAKLGERLAEFRARRERARKERR
ncbi:MAG: replication-associated recombination protein A [Thermoanaerobaculia bacterium]|nr:replication-associated recombination protein A [Thermoanaerobaculia bacterium]